jgi:hypothetical protein
MDVVITVGNVRAPNAGRHWGAPNMYWPYIWWLIQTVLMGYKGNTVSQQHGHASMTCGRIFSHRL